jgi:hypothetical protein
MLTDDDWQPLRAAVPSFAERWRAFVEQPWYESDPSYTVSELARHLVDEAAAGRAGELPAFFAALDDLLATGRAMSSTTSRRSASSRTSCTRPIGRG